MDIKQLNKALNFFRLELGDIPVQQLIIFLEVAEKDGEIARVDLVKSLDMPQGTVSRNVARLSEKVVQTDTLLKDIGYGLIQSQLDGSGRRESLFLTSKGKNLLKKLENILR